MYNSPPETSLQEKFDLAKKRNRVVLRCCRGLGFSLPEIRKALLTLNGIQARDLCRDQEGVPLYVPSAASQALSSYRTGGAAVEHVRQRLSEVLGVPLNHLFTQEELHGSKRGRG